MQARTRVGVRGFAALTLGIALLAAGCSGDTSTDNENGDGDADVDGSTISGTAVTECIPGDRIGVILPIQTSQNWKLAEKYFAEDIEDAGFEPDIRLARPGDSVGSQQRQLDRLINLKSKVLVVAAQDGDALGTQLARAEAAGIPIIAYDRPIESGDTDYYVAFGNYEVGQMQGQALLDGLAQNKGEGPYNVELFAGASIDPNAQAFFDGAMSVLQPEIDSGKLVVLSGQTSFDDVETERWQVSQARERIRQLLDEHYDDDTQLHGVLSPNDALARTIINNATSAGQSPIVTGQDSEPEAVEFIMDGKQYSTIYKDTRKLVSEAVSMVEDLCAGVPALTNDEYTTSDGSNVPANYLEPILVTQENAAEAYQDNPDLYPLTQ